MPRAQTSKEGAIVAFFRTAPIEVATVVHKLSGEELRARVQRSNEAKQRAKQQQRPAAPAPAPRPAAAPTPGPKKKTKKKAAKKKPQTVAPGAEVDGGVYTEDDLNS